MEQFEAVMCGILILLAFWQLLWR